MKLEDIFTAEELALIDSGDYRPGRAVLDAKIDLAASIEREACSRICLYLMPPPSLSRNDASFWDVVTLECTKAIRARGQA